MTSGPFRIPQSALGFTLLEVLVATALMGIAVAALMQGVSGSLRNLSRAEAYEKAVLVGRAQLNRLLSEQTLQPGRLAGQWDESVRWEAEIRRWDPTGAGSAQPGAAQPPLVIVRLTVFWKAAGGPRSNLLQRLPEDLGGLRLERGGEKSVTFETCKYEPNLPQP